jgi:hypothetical protein
MQQGTAALLAAAMLAAGREKSTVRAKGVAIVSPWYRRTDPSRESRNRQRRRSQRPGRTTTAGAVPSRMKEIHE